MSEPADTYLLDFADKHVESLSRSPVNGHATVKTTRGFFTYPTLRDALTEAMAAHPPSPTQDSSAVRTPDS